MLSRSRLQRLRGLLVSTVSGGGSGGAAAAVSLADLPSSLTQVARRHASMAASSTAASPSEAEVLSEERFGTKIAILNRPKKLNAVTPVMVDRLKELYEGWEKDPHVHMVVLKGNGRAFCAGGDVAGVYHMKKAGKIREAVEFFSKEYVVNYLIGTYKKPYIALLHGITMGGGTGLSIHGHLRVVTENTVFAMPETSIALHPDVGASYYLPRLPGHLGEYLALTGTRLDGADMMAANLATHFVPSHRLGMLEERLGSLNTEEVDVISNAIDEHCDIVQLKEKSPIHRRKEIDSCFGRSSMEEIVRALEAGNQTENPWYQETLNALKKASPLSLKVALRSVREGRRQSLRQCLEREMRLSFHAVEGLHCDDFAEGCRAVLVDKDNQPKWNPPSLEEVSAELVDYHFSPIEADFAEELQLPERMPQSTSGEQHSRL